MFIPSSDDRRRHQCARRLGSITNLYVTPVTAGIPARQTAAVCSRCRCSTIFLLLLQAVLNIQGAGQRRTALLALSVGALLSVATGIGLLTSTFDAHQIAALFPAPRC